MIKLSIVTTLYRSANYIEEFHRRVSQCAKELVDEEYEIVFVNDGSPDNSLEVVVHLAEIDSHVVVVDLSRNFGHHKAMMTGLSHACGDRVFLIDSDLEEEPEFLAEFANVLQREDADVVYGVQKKRKGGWFERWSGQVFYNIFRWLSGLALPQNMITARLMTRRYVDSLLLHTEREIFVAGLWHITGFKQIPVFITKHSTSETTYTLRAKIGQLLSSVTSFSNAPLIAIFYVGATIFLLAALYILVIVCQWIFVARHVNGWTSLMVSVWLLGGLIISFVGIVGMYISKIFLEVKNRPYTIVRQIYKRTICD